MHTAILNSKMDRNKIPRLKNIIEIKQILTVSGKKYPKHLINIFLLTNTVLRFVFIYKK